jgi:hypothetical protein
MAPPVTTTTTTAAADNNNKKLCCDCCGKAAPKLLACGQCHSVHYCSHVCQKKDWKDNKHKENCKPGASVVLKGFWKFVEQAKLDNSITEEEYKLMPLTINRIAGDLNLNKVSLLSTSNANKDCQTNLMHAVIFIWDRRLLCKGRGVWFPNLPASKKKYEKSIGYIQQVLGALTDPRRTYKVRILEPNADGDSPRVYITLTLKPEQLRMMPLNDTRHSRDDLEFDEFPDKVYMPDADPYLCHRFRQYIPLVEGFKWEYRCENTFVWKEYDEPVQHCIETLYDMGSHHFLYRPGAPHCEGLRELGTRNRVLSDTVEAPCKGDIWLMNPHDTATRQVVFSHPMTERDLYTGMRRYVRRSGPEPPEEKDLIGQKDLLGPEFRVWDSSSPTPHCGLCFSTKGRFVQMDCCGGWVCDTEDQYELGSYDREGQCARNHRYGSICNFHFQEEHDGDWKECQACIGSFHPYDYAVKASSIKDSRTIRRYNFDDNVRTDLDLTLIDFPKCHECNEPVDTTEELTRTLMMRRGLGGGKVFCKYHGGHFGQAKIEHGKDMKGTGATLNMD